MRDRPVYRVLREEARAWAAIILIVVIFAGLKTWLT